MKDRLSFSSHDSGTGRYPMLYGMLIGALLVGLVWLVMASRGGGAPGGYDGAGRGTLTGARDAERARSQATSGATPDVQMSPHASRRRLARCRQVDAAQKQPLEAAASSMAQWQIHIGAMNKLVLGVITLQQANQFWNQTRVGAYARLRAFARADARLNQQTIRCPTPTSGSAPTNAQQCERAVAADGRVLALARTALATWRIHVKHMEMLRSGTMSPAQATRMWLHSWHEGQGQVTRYRTAVGQAQGLHC